jgi:hypothetical protein
MLVRAPHKRAGLLVLSLSHPIPYTISSCSMYCHIVTGYEIAVPRGISYAARFFISLHSPVLRKGALPVNERTTTRERKDHVIVDPLVSCTSSQRESLNFNTFSLVNCCRTVYIPYLCDTGK